MIPLMPHALTPKIEPPILLPTVSSQVLDDPDNAKVEVPPPLVDNTLDDAKVEIAL